jgi:hypothetical protein
MSFSACIYLGPYIKCEKQPSTRIERLVGCTKCQQPISSAFCPNCGSPREEFEREVACDKVSGWEITENMGERLSCVRGMDEFDPDFEYFIANVKVTGIDRRLYLERTTQNIPVSEGQGMAEITAFEQHFAAELNKLKEAYGVYKIEWGFLFWFN